jgi:hypothetical protein
MDVVHLRAPTAGKHNNCIVNFNYLFYSPLSTDINALLEKYII